MKKTWSLSQILRLSTIAVIIIAVVVTIILTNITLRSVERNLPNTLIKELVSLDLVLEHLSEVVTAAEITATITTAQNFDRLTKKVQTAFESVVTLRRTYVFDNLIQASAFHAVVAPAIADLQIWLSEGISGYGPRSKTTAQIILTRISISFQKAKTLNRQSRLNAHSKLNEERNRLDRFLSSVNLLFMLTLLITLIMIFLFIRQHLLKNQEIKTQKALQTQRDLLNSLFENILLGITVWDRDGAFLFANKSFTHLTGYTVENIRNIENWFSKAYPDPVYRDRVIEDWEKSTKITNAVHEFKITCKNGQVKEIEFRRTFLPDGRALVTLADITRQKQAEAALKESEERFKMAGKASYDLIYEWDVKTDSRNWFGDIDKFLGFEKGEISKDITAWINLIHPEDRSLLENAVEFHRSATKPINYEYRIKQKDGTWRYWTDNAQPLLDENHLPFKWIGVCTDITTRKQSEQALRESEQRLRAILEASPDPMIRYNRMGHPQYLNPSFTEVFGWTQEELKEKLVPFVPEDQKQLTAKKIKEIYTRGEPLRFETKRYTKDRRIRDIILSAAVTKGVDGEPTGLVVNLTDITEKKALEAQYEQAQKMESLGTLAGGIAHDFNNLLSGIFGYLDLARKKTKNPKIAEYLTKAFNTSERAKGLTHQLLTFSKGGVPVKKIEPLVPFLKETTQFALSGANVSCSFDLPHDLWMCDYDKNQVAQVIDNIIINAHHAMPSGGKIQVTATNVIVKEKEHPILFPGNYVKISISDTGTGIPEKYISRIFDPFFTTKQTGSGLGLATGYSIIKRHGGIIDVESEPGIGTTFHTFIPSAKIQKISEEKIVESRYRGSGRILILDDEEIIQEMLIDMLESLGFTTTSTSEGSQTVQAFKKASKQNNPFRAVILDLTVPGGMGGKKVVKEIRKRDKRIPVFVVSGYSADAAIAKPGEFGFTASLEKPFKVAELTRMFEQHLKE